MNDITKLVVDKLIAERERVQNEEGWSALNDDSYVDTQLPRAAVCYLLLNPLRTNIYYNIIGELWPFSASWWKPKDPEQDLIRAGQLIIAELERLERAKRKEA